MTTGSVAGTKNAVKDLRILISLAVPPVAATVCELLVALNDALLSKTVSGDPSRVAAVRVPTLLRGVTSYHTPGLKIVNR